MALNELLPKMRGFGFLSNIERITQRTADFIRGNPLVSTAAVGVGTTGLAIAAATFSKRRKKSKAKSKRKKTRKKTKRKVKRSKGRKRKTSKTSKRRKIIRGRGIGTKEIRHSGKGTRTRLVSFRNKKTGKMVRFRVKR